MHDRWRGLHSGTVRPPVLHRQPDPRRAGGPGADQRDRSCHPRGATVKPTAWRSSRCGEQTRRAAGGFGSGDSSHRLSARYDVAGPVGPIDPVLVERRRHRSHDLAHCGVARAAGLRRVGGDPRADALRAPREPGTTAVHECRQRRCHQPQCKPGGTAIFAFRQGKGSVDTSPSRKRIRIRGSTCHSAPLSACVSLTLRRCARSTIVGRWSRAGTARTSRTRCSRAGRWPADGPINPCSWGVQSPNSAALRRRRSTCTVKTSGRL